MSSPYKTFAYYTFGCKVNFADTCTIARKLVDYGLSEVKIDSHADMYIVNTCSVTEKADKKAEKFITRIHKRSPESQIIVTGCYAQLNSKEIYKIKGVSYVVSAKNKFDIDKYLNINIDNESDDIDLVTDFNISYSLNERTRSFVKIQDGCNYICSYCTIPKARGKSRSSKITKTVEAINNIVDSGIHEIVLCGINVGDFGLDNGESLFDLLIEIEKIEKLSRYRISSIEPNLLNLEIIKFLSKSKKAMPHLHIPLQSGSNKVLKSMKRRYSKKNYKKLIETIRIYIPNICIGVDVIVGYPNESEVLFDETYDFIKKLDISYLHVFSYSDRDKTISSKMASIVTNSQKIKRRKLLRKLSNDKYNNYINKNINQIKEVLFENYSEGMLEGLTDDYIRVYAPGNNNLVNSIKKVKILKNNLHTYGQIIN
jgi:threonylcarbamoyladenosine tRNA methylthiotransferase MtaB